MMNSKILIVYNSENNTFIFLYIYIYQQQYIQNHCDYNGFELPVICLLSDFRVAQP